MGGWVDDVPCDPIATAVQTIHAYSDQALPGRSMTVCFHESDNKRRHKSTVVPITIYQRFCLLCSPLLWTRPPCTFLNALAKLSELLSAFLFRSASRAFYSSEMTCCTMSSIASLTGSGICSNSATHLLRCLFTRNSIYSSSDVSTFVQSKSGHLNPDLVSR